MRNFSLVDRRRVAQIAAAAIALEGVIALSFGVIGEVAASDRRHLEVITGLGQTFSAVLTTLLAVGIMLLILAMWLLGRSRGARVVAFVSQTVVLTIGITVFFEGPVEAPDLEWIAMLVVTMIAPSVAIIGILMAHTHTKKGVS